VKNPLTPAGIEPATFRFVAQHLNHCATAVPTFNSTRANVISFTAKITAFLAMLFTKLTNFQQHSYTEFHVNGTTNAEIRAEIRPNVRYGFHYASFREALNI